MLLGSVAGLWGCSSNDCNRAGCDALTERASGSGTGIAGVSAAESDVVENGCQVCLFADAEVAFWKIDSPSDPQADVASTANQQAIAVVKANPSYRTILEPGTYVVCAGVDSHCIETTVQADQLTTVNIKKRNGPVGLWVVDASGKFVEDFGIARPPATL